MATDDTNGDDFYIAAFGDGSTVSEAWLVHRGRPPSMCVAVCPHRDEAIAQAASLSAAQRCLGRASAVYVRDAGAEAWHRLPDGDFTPPSA